MNLVIDKITTGTDQQKGRSKSKKIGQQLSDFELSKIPFYPRSVLKMTHGFSAAFSTKSLNDSTFKKVPAIAPDFSVFNGRFSLSHLHVVECVITCAHEAYHVENGDIELRFIPGNVLRLLGQKNGCREWLLERLNELQNPIGCTGSIDFPVFNSVDTSTLDTNKSFSNLGQDPVFAKIWSVRLDANYRRWTASEASVRHDLHKQLYAFKSAAAEALARRMMVGQTDGTLQELLLEIGVFEKSWNKDKKSNEYISARRAIKKIVDFSPQFKQLGIDIYESPNNCSYFISSKNRPTNVTFFGLGAVGLWSDKNRQENNSIKSPTKSTLIMPAEQQESTALAADKKLTPREQLKQMKASHAEKTTPPVVNNAVEQVVKNKNEADGINKSPDPLTSNAENALTPGYVCQLLKSNGIASVNPAHVKLAELIQFKATEQMFINAIVIAKNQNVLKFAYVLKVVENFLADNVKKLQNDINPPDGFEQFWDAYPKKAGRFDAINIFRSMFNEIDLNLLLKNVTDKKYSKAWKDPQYIPSPANYLRKKQWLDDFSGYSSLDGLNDNSYSGLQRPKKDNDYVSPYMERLLRERFFK